MKKFIFVLLAFFIFIPQIFAQKFELPFEINQGFRIVENQAPQFYLLNTSAKPSLVIDNFILNSIVMTSISGNVTDVFAGTGANYKVYKKENFNLQLGATALFSDRRQLYGMNVIGEFDDIFYVIANARREFDQNVFWFDAGIGIKAIR